MGMSLEERLKEINDDLIPPDVSKTDQQIAQNRSADILLDLQGDPPDEDTIERSFLAWG